MWAKENPTKHAHTKRSKLIEANACASAPHKKTQANPGPLPKAEGRATVDNKYHCNSTCSDSQPKTEDPDASHVGEVVYRKDN